MNAISFSLWGNKPIYCVGAVRNAELVEKVYPGWKMVIWVADNVPNDTIKDLEKRGADVRLIDPAVSPNGMFHRFLINDDPTVERFIVRDTDSRLNQREKHAVEEWIESGKSFHVIRDHPHHDNPMMAGTWGAKTGAIKSMEKLIKNFERAKLGGDRRDIYDIDQQFLARNVWPVAMHNHVAHDFCLRNIYPDSVEFPARFGEWRFVGEVYDEHDNPRPCDWEVRINWMTP